MLTREKQIRIAAIIAIVLLLGALVLILDRFPEWQESRLLVALGIFASITSPIAIYEFLARRSHDPGESGGKSGEMEIQTGQTLEIGGDQQGTVTQNDQRGQTVEGPQTNVGVTQGPVFSGPVTYNASAKPPLPMQKPPRVEHFVGREDELASLLRDLQPGKVVTICGPGGMGKTALAAQAIWRLSPGNEPPKLFPGGIVFHSFYHKPQAALALEAIARSYGEDPRPSPQQAAIRALSGRQALIVLDGAEECDDLGAVLSATASCAVLITSRLSSDAPADFCNLPPLSIGEAVRLLRDWAGALASDEGIARRICELLGRLPLGVFLVGRYMAHRRQRADEYLGWLEKTPLAALDMGERQHESIPLLMEHSLAKVSDRARSCMGVAGVLAQKPFRPEIIAAALEISLEDVNWGLGELVEFGLLIRPDDRYQITHALAHTYARTRLAPESDILSRLAERYNDFIREKMKLGLEGYALLDEVRDHVLAVQSACNKAELWGAVRKITWDMDNYLDLQGHWEERVALLQAGLEAARSDDARYDEASFLNRLGSSCRLLGDARKSIQYHNRSLQIFREIGEKKGEGVALGSLGWDYAALDESRKAIEHYDKGLAIARETEDKKNEGIHLVNLGDAYRNLGEPRKAIEFYEQALAIAREIGDRRGEGAGLGSLGNAYYDLSEPRKAIEFYEQALAIAREIGDRRGEGARLGNLGNAYRNLGEPRKAIEFYEQALAIDREIGDRRGEGGDLGNLGLAYSNLGEPRKAIDFYEQQLSIARKIEDRRGGGNALWNMSLALDKLDNRDKAIECARAALKIYEESEDPNVERVRRKLQEWESS